MSTFLLTLSGGNYSEKKLFKDFSMLQKTAPNLLISLISTKCIRFALIRFTVALLRIDLKRLLMLAFYYISIKAVAPSSRQVNTSNGKQGVKGGSTQRKTELFRINDRENFQSQKQKKNFLSNINSNIESNQSIIIIL